MTSGHKVSKEKRTGYVQHTGPQKGLVILVRLRVHLLVDIYGDLLYPRTFILPGPQQNKGTEGGGSRRGFTTLSNFRTQQVAPAISSFLFPQSYPRSKSHHTLSSESPQRPPPHFCHLSPDARHCHACYPGRKTEACPSRSCGHSPDSLTVFPRTTASFCIDTFFCGSTIN